MSNLAQKQKDLASVQARIRQVEKQPETIKRGNDLAAHYAREEQLRGEIQRLEQSGK